MHAGMHAKHYAGAAPTGPPPPGSATAAAELIAAWPKETSAPAKKSVENLRFPDMMALLGVSARQASSLGGRGGGQG